MAAWQQRSCPRNLLACLCMIWQSLGAANGEPSAGFDLKGRLIVPCEFSYRAVFTMNPWKSTGTDWLAEKTHPLKRTDTT